MKTSVLVVDGDRELLQLFCIVFAQLDVDCHTAESGADALAMLRDLEVDMIVIDTVLADMTGYELAATLRRQGNRAYLVTVAGLRCLDDMQKSFDAGFDEHLTKPARLPQIVAALSKARLRALE